MKAIAIVMVAVSAAWVCATQADAGLSVRLMDAVRVKEAQYRLADIAHVETSDQSLKQKLEETTIGVAPRLGYTERVSRVRVAGLIESLHPQLHGAIDWTGSEQISIRSAGETLPLQPLIEQAREALLSELRRQWSDIQQFDIQPVSAHPDIAVPFGKTTVVPRIAAGTKPNKRLCAWLDISVDGKHYQTVPVWFSLKAYRQVLAAKRPMTVHHLLREEDVVMESRDVAGIADALTDFSQLQGSFWLKRPLPEGSVVAAENIEKMPLVRSGQNVRVTLAMGPVHIETEGVAQVYGRMGDTVRVQNRETRGIYAARVTGLGEVTVSAR